MYADGQTHDSSECLQACLKLYDLVRHALFQWDCGKEGYLIIDYFWPR